MKNPDLTPLNGLDVGLKAHNTRICGSGHSAFTQIEACEEVEQGQAVLLSGKTLLWLRSSFA
jgi:hypothetical protein